jgi:hypothetical protein
MFTCWENDCLKKHKKTTSQPKSEEVREKGVGEFPAQQVMQPVLRPGRNFLLFLLAALSLSFCNSSPTQFNRSSESDFSQYPSHESRCICFSCSDFHLASHPIFKAPPFIQK